MDYPSTGSGQAPSTGSGQAHGTELFKYQWDFIHNPEGGWFVFEDSEEGASPWLTTHLSDITRILGNIRCSFVEKRPFSFPKPTGISSGHLSANFPLGTNEIPVTVSISNDILDFVPTIISYDAEGNDARFHFPNFVVKTDTQNAEALRSYLNGTTTSEADQEATQRLESLLQANKPSDALDELYRLPTCLVCTFSAETRLQLLSAIASETVSDDSRDYAAIDLMRCFVDKSQGDVLFKAFEENHQFINALFNRVQDDYTQDVFIALFLEAYTQRYSTDEPQVQPNSYFVANRTITGVYLGSNRLNGPPYTITLRQLDTRVGHYTNVQRYNPCDVVGMVIPAIESSSQDQIIYLPALYLYSVLQQKAQQDLVDFLVGAAQVAGIFSGTSLFISGVSTFQKVMGCVEALNAATNVVLETDAVRTQLLATEYGQDFLDSWGTISTAVDLATVGTALATFRRTAPQVLDEIDTFVPEGSLGIRNIRRVSGAGRFIAKSGTELKTYLDDLVTLPAGKTYNGQFYKSINTDFHPNPNPQLIDDYATLNLDHRYSKVGESGYYVSQTNTGNITEMGFTNGVPTNYKRYRYDNVSIDNMLDLTDDVVRQQLGVTEEMIKKLGEGKYEYTHILGTWAKDRYKGIIYPGAQGGNYTNVIIFKQIDVDNALGNLIANPL